jgi:tetratricopeptide (TPR) repeat protein
MAGRVALGRRDWKAAEAPFRRVLQLDPHSWTALNNLGVALRRQGRRKEAIEYFEAAARANPRASVARDNLFRSVSRHAGVGGLAGGLILVLKYGLIAVPAAHAIDNLASPIGRNIQNQPIAVAGIFLLVLCVVVLDAIYRWRRRQRLSPTVRAFHKAELRRRCPWGRLRARLALRAGGIHRE